MITISEISVCLAYKCRYRLIAIAMKNVTNFVFFTHTRRHIYFSLPSTVLIIKFLWRVLTWRQFILTIMFRPFGSLTPNTVFTVFRLLTDFVCLYNYEFWLSLCKIVRSSVILLLPLYYLAFQSFNYWTDEG